MNQSAVIIFCSITGATLIASKLVRSVLRNLFLTCGTLIKFGGIPQQPMLVKPQKMPKNKEDLFLFISGKFNGKSIEPAQIRRKSAEKPCLFILDQLKTRRKMWSSDICNKIKIIFVSLPEKLQIPCGTADKTSRHTGCVALG